MRNSTLKFCAMLLVFCTSAIHLQAMDEWDGNAVAQGFYSGTGTEADPYRIFTASQFLYFIQQTRDGNTFNGQYIELCNDISFRTNEGLKNGGDFYGDFDGNDHTIKVDKYEEGIEGYLLYGWHLFNLYGSMHDVLFVKANEVMTIYTGGILYNCRFEFGGYHRNWTVRLQGGTIANCVSDAASSYQYLDSKPAQGFVAKYASDNPYNPHGYCLNCYFPIESKDYNGYTVCENYYGTIESCGEEAGNDWVQSHTEYTYKSWPLTFNPTYPEYQIKEQPQSYSPSVVCPNSDKALYQWCYQGSMPITFETIGFTETKSIAVPYDNMVLSFDFEADPYVTSSYNKDDIPALISINGEKILNTYDEKAATYSCQLSAGTCEISCQRSYIKNIRLAYPTELLANETSSVLSKQTIMERPGVYFCQVSYGEGCDVMNSDYVDYENLLTINNVTYVINEDATATVLWAADKVVEITIPETVNYDAVDYPVTSISSKAFADCTSLASIKCNTSDVPALLGGTTFEGLIPSNVSLSVPTGSESTYSTAEGWNEFTMAGDIVEYKNSIYFEDATAFVNTTIDLPLQLKNENDITAVQFDVYLPEGISIEKNARGKYNITFNEDRADNMTHTLSSALQSDGAVRVICYSTDSELFWGNEGAIFNFPLEVSDMEEGEYSIIIKKIIITEQSGKKHEIASMTSTLNVLAVALGDCNRDNAVDVADIVTLANHILNNPVDVFVEKAADFNKDNAVDVADIVAIANFILGGNTSAARALTRDVLLSRAASTDYSFDILPFVLATEGSRTISLDLADPTESFTAFQCDLYLPEGISINKNKRGKYDLSFNEERTDADFHTLSGSQQSDGSVRILCYSTDSEVFLGTDGALINIPLTADVSLESGVYEFSIANTVLTYQNGTKVEPVTYKGSIIVGDGGEVESVKLQGKYTASVLENFSSALSTNKSVTSVDLTEAVSVAESGVLTTGNPNTLIYLSEDASLANENNVVCGDECENLVLTDAYAFSTPMAFDAVKATYTRTLPNTMWNALYLPFEVSVGALSDYDVASFSSLNLNADNSMSMTVELTDGVEANTPYIIRAKNDGALALSIEQSDVIVEAESNTLSLENGSKKASITGVYAETVASDIAGAYAISGGAFKRAASDEQVLKSFRFYLMLTENGNPIQYAALKTISINVTGAEGTTSIDDGLLNGNSETIVYDLHGRRVSNPGEGVYIVNGEKVVVK